MAVGLAWARAARAAFLGDRPLLCGAKTRTGTWPCQRTVIPVSLRKQARLDIGRFRCTAAILPNLRHSAATYAPTARRRPAGSIVAISGSRDTRRHRPPAWNW